jgi:GNAT superfamily N-acetyltransferase/predicted GNAT family N-acyltransferase
MDLEVRQATQKDCTDIGYFLEEGFANTYRYPERWEWLNVQNPYIGHGLVAPSWIAISDGRIVGHIGTMQVKVKICERTLNAAWSADFLVSSATRGLGVGTKVMAARINSKQLPIDLEMTHISRAIEEKVGYRKGAAVSLLYRTAHFLTLPLYKQIGSALHRNFGGKERSWESVAKQTGCSKACCWILKKMIQARQRHKMVPSGSPTYTIELVTRFDEQADALWTVVRSRYTFAVERSSAYLNWKYFDQPHMSHQCFYLREHGSVNGILVLRQGTPPEHNIGVICECYLSEPDPAKYTWLIEKAITKLTEQGTAGIWAATADRKLEEIYRKLGFLRIRQAKMMMHIRNTEWNHSDIFARPLIGKGDHDWDQYPNLRQPSFGQFIKLAVEQNHRKTTL